MTDDIKDTAEEIKEEQSPAPETAETCEKEPKKKKKERELEAEVLKYKEAAEKAEAALKESEDKYMRILAEYDNFRKRTAKEKEGIYSDAYSDALTQILPIIDNLERASGMSGDKVVEGVNMIFAQFKDTLARLGVEEIPAEVGGEFDPELHNAVMSANNPDLPSGSIAIVLQKGYKKGDKVFRYTMVSVNQ